MTTNMSCDPGVRGVHSWILQDQKGTGSPGSFLCQFRAFAMYCGGTCLPHMLLHRHTKVMVLLILREPKGQGLSVTAARVCARCTISGLQHALQSHLCGHADVQTYDADHVTPFFLPLTPQSQNLWLTTVQEKSEETAPEHWGHRHVPPW